MFVGSFDDYGSFNDYEDSRRAAAYDELTLRGTYHLVFGTLPFILAREVQGIRALDFGCGTGRSTRFLRAQGFEAVGADISAEMVGMARRRDPTGDYRIISDGDLSGFDPGSLDLVLSAFTFDNVPGRLHRVRLFSELARLLSPTGRLVNVVSSPEIYTNEWVSFTTRDFPDNRKARPGQVVRIVTVDHSDRRPLQDLLWPDRSYRATYRRAGLEVVRMERPLATGREGVPWKSETRIPPWTIYVLRRCGDTR